MTSASAGPSASFDPGRVIDPCQDFLPAGAGINREIAPHDEDFLPAFSRNRLGRVTQRIIHRQKAETDDFQRNEDDGENGDTQTASGI